MLVLDASVVVELLVSDDLKKIEKLENRLKSETLVAPDHMWLEVVSVISRMARSGALSELDAQRVIQQLQRLNIRVITSSSFVQRIWKLRKNVFYLDAAYIAVAESLGAPLLTSDKKLSRATGPECIFELW